MKYRKLTPDGDYMFGHGMNDFYVDGQAVGQAVKTRLKLLYGEWWEDLTLGVPMFQGIIGRRGTPANVKTAELIISDAIKGTEGVVSIHALNVDYNSVTRRMSYRATIQTEYSTVDIEEVI